MLFASPWHVLQDWMLVTLRGAPLNSNNSRQELHKLQAPGYASPKKTNKCIRRTRNQAEAGCEQSSALLESRTEDFLEEAALHNFQLSWWLQHSKAWPGWIQLPSLGSRDGT